LINYFKWRIISWCRIG